MNNAWNPPRSVGRFHRAVGAIHPFEGPFEVVDTICGECKRKFLYLFRWFSTDHLTDLSLHW
jgi:hypothetical protein